ncbi:hypothetical protein HPB51_018781 [Rhipicephalus microplus]|uniref:SHSP domain-containing protein n=1 Tax=Rhipicephalus microplus TaxID=6941 RepID=A0A9J6DI85_RHIMP|nr:hypothetical protein HPB51_018781 [Rhipicephalus microplus]
MTAFCWDASSCVKCERRRRSSWRPWPRAIGGRSTRRRPVVQQQRASPGRLWSTEAGSPPRPPDPRTVPARRSGPQPFAGRRCNSPAGEMATAWRKGNSGGSRQDGAPAQLSRHSSQRYRCRCGQCCRDGSRDNLKRPTGMARSFDDLEPHHQYPRCRNASRHRNKSATRGRYGSNHRFGLDDYHCVSASPPTSPAGDKLCQSHPSSTQFKVVLDVRQFNPEDLTVKTCGKHAVIQAVRTEDRGRKGIIVKEFTRRYLLPDGADADRVSCSLTEDGFLTVDVPMKDPPLIENERIVPITVIHGSGGGGSTGQQGAQSLSPGQQPCQEYKKNQTCRRPSRLSLHSDDIG